jgi:hypothetical protein
MEEDRNKKGSNSSNSKDDRSLINDSLNKLGNLIGIGGGEDDKEEDGQD